MVKLNFCTKNYCRKCKKTKCDAPTIHKIGLCPLCNNPANPYFVHAQICRHHKIWKCGTCPSITLHQLPNTRHTISSLDPLPQRLVCPYCTDWFCTNCGNAVNLGSSLLCSNFRCQAWVCINCPTDLDIPTKTINPPANLACKKCGNPK